MICDTTTLHLLCKLAQSIDEIFTDKRIFLLRPTQQLKEKKKKYLWYVTQRSIFYITLSWHDGSMKFYEEGTPSNLLGKNLEGKPIQEKSNGEGVWKDEGWGTPLARRCVRAIDNQPFFPSLLHESIPLRVTPPRSFRFFTLPLRPSQGEGGIRLLTSPFFPIGGGGGGPFSPTE